ADLDAGTARPLLENAMNPTLSASGHLVFFRGRSELSQDAYFTDGALWAVPFDPGRLTIQGQPVPVENGVRGSNSGAGQYSIADDGTLAYVAGTGEEPRRRLLWVERDGVATPALDEPGSYRDPRISPDGDRLAVNLLGDVWLADVARRNPNRLTFGKIAGRPIWGPGGRTVTFGQFSDEGYNVFEVPAGGGEPVALSRGFTVLVPAAWDPEGRVLVCRYLDRSDGDWDVVLLDRESDAEPRPLLDSPYRELHPTLSPGGDALAYTSDETGTVEVYIQDFPRLGNKVKVSNGGGTEPLWTRGGAELVYRTDSHLMAVAVTADPVTGERRVGEPRPLFDDRYLKGELGQTANYDVAADGERFLMIELEDPGKQEIVVVLDWFTELERLAPTSER
ncbi:MAG: hypothetical protein R3190_18880, partial [Thermoanaerobaculia bacterium]|nr:hypothetical protein [Thermoanaerobaculia bacterium]